MAAYMEANADDGGESAARSGGEASGVPEPGLPDGEPRGSSSVESSEDTTASEEEAGAGAGRDSPLERRAAGVRAGGRSSYEQEWEQE